MTAFINGITLPPLLSCLWVDMLLCRHLLASMEGQNIQYKLRNGTLTHTFNLASDVDSFTLSGCQGFTLVPKTSKTYKETKPVLGELVSSGRL